MPWQISCIVGEAQPSRITVDGLLELGRDPHCDVRLLAEGASRFHARLRPEGQGLILEDNDSANGTYLNGRRIRRAELADGATFICAGVRFAVLGPDARAATQVLADDGVALAITRHQPALPWQPGDDPAELPWLHDGLKTIAALAPDRRAKALAGLASRCCRAPHAATVLGLTVSGQDMSERLARRLAGGSEARLLVLGKELVGRTIAAEAVGSAASAPIGSLGHLVVARGLEADPLGATELERLGRLAAEATVWFSGPDADHLELVGSSLVMRNLRQRIHRLAAAEAPVLVTGESGTGKDLIARALHDCSGRRHGPLVPVNCAAVAEELFAAELFGHEKGAFTGAESARPGRFRAAEGGTLFLDEVGELPPAMQAKLLRALQERTIEPVGADRPVSVNVRIVAATNRDLAADVAEGRFRQDLFYRLDVLRIHSPALRDHLDDLPAIAAALLERAAIESGRPAPAISPSALEHLRRQSWPGNVRQLANVLQRALVLAEEVIERADLDPDPGLNPQAADRFPTLAELEARHIAAALVRTGNNRTQAARILGISRPTLLKKISDYGIR